MMEVSLKVPLGEQLHLKEMFAMMEENRMDAQAQNLEDFLQYFNQMEKYFEDMQDELLYLRGQLDQLNDKTHKIDNFPDVSPSSADLILTAVREGRDWRPSFEGSLSLYGVVSHYISSAIDDAAEKYLDNIYGSRQIQTHKEIKR